MRSNVFPAPRRLFFFGLAIASFAATGLWWSQPSTAKPPTNAPANAQEKPLTGDQIIAKMDTNMVFETRKVMSEMRIYKQGTLRTKKMKSYSKGEDTSYSEFLHPARDKGVKYLKIGDNLWMYLPSAEKVVKISGHMLRQSMMGSDFSYEDMLEARKMRENYNTTLLGTEKVGKHECYVLELKEKKPGQTYPKRKYWIAKKIFVPLRSEMFAASGRLLKVMSFREIREYEGRHYPTVMRMENKMNQGTWTEVVMTDLEFRVPVPDQVFSLRNLQRE